MRILARNLATPPALLVLACVLPGCNNNPYGSFADGRVMYSALSGDPRTLDPTRVSDSESGSIASNIHDTPYEFHYLKRPLELVPSMATAPPVEGTAVLDGTTHPTFRFSIKPGLRFMNDPCFPGGRGREIKIDDLILAIKRAADSSLDPFGKPLLMGRLVGFAEFGQELEKAHAAAAQTNRSPASEESSVRDGQASDPVSAAYAKDISGVRRIDDYTLELVLVRENPVIKYFFAQIMSSPIPGECLAHYNGENGRPPYDRHPVASGAYYVDEWHANHRLVLKRNPNYRRDDFYPSEGEDEAEGLLKLRGARLPMVDEFRMLVIQSGPALWTLFDQGYLDRAGIPRDVYNEVITRQELSPAYVKRGIKLDKEVELVTFWYYFNMIDPLFKNNADLRRALSLAFNREEYIERFLNNRGIPAQSLIPPGLEGYDANYRNEFSSYDVARAKALLARAGYPDGRDPKTGRNLKITITDVARPAGTSQYRFVIDQFRAIGVDVKIEPLDWPTVLERKQKKNFQIVQGGWGADYPDPQNFLQLFYGPNIATSYNENSYHNVEFDRLYDRMKNMRPGPEREEILHRMRDIMNADAPILYLFHRVAFALSHKWVAPLRPHPIGNNQLKYRNLDPELRETLTADWNRPSTLAYLALAGILAALALLALLAVREYRRLEK